MKVLRILRILRILALIIILAILLYFNLFVKAQSDWKTWLLLLFVTAHLLGLLVDQDWKK